MHKLHLSGIDLNLAVVLHAVLTERSVSRTAKRLGLSQSATSHALGRLRDLLGEPVVVRTRDGVVPTPRAEALTAELGAALQGLENVLLGVPAFDPATTERRFYVGASDYAEFVLFPPLLAHITKTAPGVDVWIKFESEPYGDRLRRGDVDVVLGVPASIEDPQGIESAELFHERFVCIVRKGHPLARGRVTPERFANARHAFIAPRGRPGGAVDSALEALGLERRIVFAVPHFLVAPHVVAETDLVLTVAERVARAYARTLPVQIFEPPIPIPPFTLCMFWHRRYDADPAHRWLREVIVKMAAERTSVRNGSRAAKPRLAPVVLPRKSSRAR